VDLGTATAHTFLPHRGSQFHLVRAGSDDALLRLEEVTSGGRQPGAPRAEPFSLVFVGSSEPILAQGTYRVGHGELGEFEIFLVPIGIAADGGVRYEAVFN
jgi:hypothetical protein